MGRMKEIYMELYYSMDGCIPPEYDLDGYLAKKAQELQEEEEYEYSKKTNKTDVSVSNKTSSFKKRNSKE